MNTTSLKYILLAAMACAVAASNMLVTIPINDFLTVAAFTYPVVFVITDIANNLLGKTQAYRVVLMGFVCGVGLSFISSDPRIAIASGTAFLLAQLLDVEIFAVFRNQRWWKAPVFSSACASITDTFLFFGIAFIGTGLPWFTWSLGDLAAKGCMLLILLPLYRVICAAMQPRLQPNPANN